MHHPTRQLLRSRLTPVFAIALLFQTATVSSIASEPNANSASWSKEAVLDGCGGVCLEYSDDGKKILTANRMHVRVWDAATFKPITAVLDHGGTISDAALSSDGRRMVTVGENWEDVEGRRVHCVSGCKVWDTQTGRLILSLKAHGAGHGVCAAALSPDGMQVATCAAGDREARVWDVQTGKVTLTVRMADEIQFVLFSPDGRRLLTADTGARQWTLPDGKPVGEVMPARADRSPRAACYSRKGDILALCNHDRIYVFDARTSMETANTAANQLPIVQQMFESVRLSDDGKVAATTASSYGSRAWDTSTTAPLTDIKEGVADVVADISRDGTRLLCGGPPESGGVWDIRSGRRIAQLEKDTDFTCCRFSPDGRRVALSWIGEGGSTEIWEISSKENR
jgi:WD40 repeat protein